MCCNDLSRAPVTRWAPGVFELKLTRHYQVINRYQIFGQVINRVGEIAAFGHKWGKGFRKRAAHPYQIFLGVPSRDYIGPTELGTL